MVAEKLQLLSGVLFSHSLTDDVEHKTHGLIGSGFVGDNAVVKEVTDDGKVYFRMIRNTVLGLRYLFFYLFHMRILSRHTIRPLS